MGLDIGFLKNFDLRLTNSRFFRPESFLGRFIGVGQTDDFIKDTATFLTNRDKKKVAAGGFTRLLGRLPIGIQSKLGGVLGAFNRFPGMSRIPSLTKFNLLFMAATDAFGVAKDAVKGFQNTEGGIVSKITGGIKSGVKSVIQSAGAFAAAVGGALAVPALLGLSLTGPLGIIVSAVGSGVAGSMGRKVMNRFVQPNPPKPDPEMTNLDPVTATHHNPIIQSVEDAWANREQNPFSKGANPWLSGNPAMRL